MSDKFEDFEDILDDTVEAFDVLVLTDEETGEDIELVVIDRVVQGDEHYLLVVEANDLDNEESAASIVKEIALSDGEFSYEILEDDEEFDKISQLFSDTDDFEIK